MIYEALLYRKLLVLSAVANVLVNSELGSERARLANHRAPCLSSMHAPSGAQKVGWATASSSQLDLAFALLFHFLDPNGLLVL